MLERTKTFNSSNSNLFKESICEGVSMFLFPSDNEYRIFLMKVVKSRYFDGFIFGIIAISSILLALDNPLNDPESVLVQTLYYFDFIFTIFFVCESVFKIIAYGLLFNGENSYLRSTWNFIDFLVVIFSVISLIITSSKLKIVKIFRLLRVLRPLRVISRNKGLRIGIQALFRAIPNIFNVLVITLLFFTIFSIIGVNYFKGAFYSCDWGDQVLPDGISLDLVVTKYDCFNLGGAWHNFDQNFDNVPAALSTLF